MQVGATLSVFTTVIDVPELKLAWELLSPKILNSDCNQYS